jgi:hypothetical protein
MDVKQFKTLKDELNQKLYTGFRNLVQGGDIATTIHDDLENLELSILQEKADSRGNTVVIETNFYYNIYKPASMSCKLNNRTLLGSAKGDVLGIVSDYSQIDLETMNLLRDYFYQFALDNDLITEEKGEGVGVDSKKENTP